LREGRRRHIRKTGVGANNARVCRSNGAWSQAAENWVFRADAGILEELSLI